MSVIQYFNIDKRDLRLDEIITTLEHSQTGEKLLATAGRIGLQIRFVSPEEAYGQNIKRAFGDAIVAGETLVATPFDVTDTQADYALGGTDIRLSVVRSDGSAISNDELLTTLAHELMHITQFQEGGIKSIDVLKKENPQLTREEFVEGRLELEAVAQATACRVAYELANHSDENIRNAGPFLEMSEESQPYRYVARKYHAIFTAQAAFIRQTQNAEPDFQELHSRAFEAAKQEWYANTSIVEKYIAGFGGTYDSACRKERVGQLREAISDRLNRSVILDPRHEKTQSLSLEKAYDHRIGF